MESRPTPILDVRDVPARLRHARILQAFEALRPGDAFVLVSDHDPRPLYYQFQAERPGAFAWRYVEEGPETWRVEIGKAAAPARPPGSPDPMPAALAELPASARVHVDVRDDIRRGQEPFARIMAAVKGLPPDAALVLQAPFEPTPLYDVLGKRGLAHWTECRGADDWVVWFYRAATAGPGPTPASAPTAAPGTVRLDVRGLEPPEPMVRVLAALETLVSDQELEVLHERRPMFLYPQLDDRGFVHETEEVAPGLVRLRIRRREGR